MKRSETQHEIAHVGPLPWVKGRSSVWTFIHGIRFALGVTLIAIGLVIVLESWGLLGSERHIIELRRDVPVSLENGALFEVPADFQTRLGLLMGLVGVGLGLNMAIHSVRGT